MVPMATVILLLLFFFLLCSTLILQPGVKVKINLPSTGFSGLAPQSRLIVTVAMGNVEKPEGQIFFKDQRVQSLAELEAALKREANRDSNQTVVLKADRRLPQGTVLNVMNAALSAGLPVVIASQSAPTQP